MAELEAVLEVEREMQLTGHVGKEALPQGRVSLWPRNLRISSTVVRVVSCLIWAQPEDESPKACGSVRAR